MHPTHTSESFFFNLHLRFHFLTICPETITELICFRLLRCKTYVPAPEINSPSSPSLGIPPTPDRGPNPHFLEKRVLGSKNPHFPSRLQRLEKGVFGPKIPIFYVFPCRKMGIFGPKTPFSRTRGNGGFWTPKPSFPGNGDSGPGLGSGESSSPSRQKLRDEILSSPL